MSAEKALIEKQEELKHRLAAGEYKTLVDVILDWFDRLLRKITRRPQPLPGWIIGVILVLLINLMGYTINSITGEWTNTKKYFDLLDLRFETGILWKLWDSILAVTVLFVINGFIGRILSLWGSEIIDATGSTSSLAIFENWLAGICNRRLHSIVAMVGGLSASFFSAGILSTVNLQYSFIGKGFALMQMINYIINFSSFYLFLMFIFLAANLRRYDMRLFAADPSSSELVFRLSGALNFVVYIIAAFAVISAPVFTIVGFTVADMLVLLFLWLPIVAMFMVNQSSLSSIIRRAKWKTLNDIQAKVENLQAEENFGDKETMDAIKRLMDYHDRVKATRDSALDFRTYFSFFNSLLLPLLAFILGNLDLVMKLLGRNP